MRRCVTVAAALVAMSMLTGCGSGWFARGQECAPVGYREGIGLDIEPPFAAGVASAALRVCWEGRCRDADVELYEKRDTIATPCEGSDRDAACGAKVGPPTGGQHGFADLTGLPGKPVQVTVVLRSAAGAVVLEEQLTVTPREPEADGTCGSGGRKQSGIIVEAGQVRERT